MLWKENINFLKSPLLTVFGLSPSIASKILVHLLKGDKQWSKCKKCFWQEDKRWRCRLDTKVGVATLWGAAALQGEDSGPRSDSYIASIDRELIIGGTFLKIIGKNKSFLSVSIASAAWYGCGEIHNKYVHPTQCFSQSVMRSSGL